MKHRQRHRLKLILSPYRIWGWDVSEYKFHWLITLLLIQTTAYQGTETRPRRADISEEYRVNIFIVDRTCLPQLSHFVVDSKVVYRIGHPWYGCSLVDNAIPNIQIRKKIRCKIVKKKKKKKKKKKFYRNGRKHSHKINFVTQKSTKCVTDLTPSNKSRYILDSSVTINS